MYISSPRIFEKIQEHIEAFEKSKSSLMRRFINMAKATALEYHTSIDKYVDSTNVQTPQSFIITIGTYVPTYNNGSLISIIFEQKIRRINIRLSIIPTNDFQANQRKRRSESMQINLQRCRSIVTKR